MTRKTESAPPKPASEPGARILPLENGDRLTRDEFERRYDAMPHLKKAELIEGVVHVPSPVSVLHGEPHAIVTTWVGVYMASTRGTREGDNTSLRLDLDNMPQPDVFLRIDPERGGQSRTSEDHYVEGAPELIAEVAASSASYDLHAKLHVYRRNGVREYIVWRTFDAEIDWFVLEGSAYRRLAPDPLGVLKSRVFPGLWLEPAALLRGDAAKVLAVLGDGLRSAEHAEFAQRLESAAKREK